MVTVAYVSDGLFRHALTPTGLWLMILEMVGFEKVLDLSAEEPPTLFCD